MGRFDDFDQLRIMMNDEYGALVRMIAGGRGGEERGF
jgi:hypothetical protein